MTTVFVRTKANSWLNVDKIEVIDSDGKAYTEGDSRYQLIDNWWHPGNQIILGGNEEPK